MTRNEELTALREAMSRVPKPGIAPEARRAAWDAAAAFLPDPPDVSFEGARLGGIEATIVRRGAHLNAGHVLYVHGGSYTAGSLATHRAFLASLAQSTGMVLLAPWYRLAPEHPFPAAVDDVLAAYRAAIDMESKNLLVVGDSAGAGLALAMLMRARDAGLPMPKALACFSPWLDLSTDRVPTAAEMERDFVLDWPALVASAQAYLAGADPRDPLASPALGDWTGLPPALIQVGGAELLLADAFAGASAASRAGVFVTLEIFPGMPHGFHLLGHALTDAARALERASQWLTAQCRTQQA
ncbi:MAG: alpha/beta hydrolase [Rubrivivax sp.]|nr:MAG: alpha/beta hydrolase [Rubrivivax sp.]